MICHNHKSNTFGIELVMQLGNGHHKTGMLNLSKKFVDFDLLSKMLLFFFLKQCEHLLHGIKKLAKRKCALTLVVEGHLDTLGIGNLASRVAFASIMVMQSEHVMTIFMMCDGMDPDLSKFALEKASQKGVDTMGIGLILLTFEQSTSNHLLGEGKVLCSVFRFYFFMNNIC